MEYTKICLIPNMPGTIYKNQGVCYVSKDKIKFYKEYTSMF